MGKDENSGVYTKREIPGHHKQNKANQIMETEEQRKRRLGKSYRYAITKPKKINPRIYVISDKLRRLPNK
jgi:hypothetical protein